MQENNFVNERVYELKKVIPILEWDIPRIKDNNLKAQREGRLKQYKKELEELLEKIKLIT